MSSGRGRRLPMLTIRDRWCRGSVASVAGGSAATVAQEGAEVLLVRDSRVGCRDPVLKERDEPIGFIEVQKVARSLEHFESAFRSSGVSLAAVVNRDDPIQRSPYDQERQLRGEVQAVSALYGWPVGSRLARIVCMNAARVCGSRSEA